MNYTREESFEDRVYRIENDFKVGIDVLKNEKQFKKWGEGEGLIAIYKKTIYCKVENEFKDGLEIKEYDVINQYEYDQLKKAL